MKHIFILDENIFILACKGTNAKGQEDQSSCILILQIARNCHKIAWNKELKRRYSLKTEIIKKSPEYELFMKSYKIFFDLMTNAEKSTQNESIFLDGGPELDDDRHVISLAVFTKGILVTEDCRLKKALLKKNFISKYGLQIRKPSEALIFADEK
jgi:hypothetical protein